MIPLAAMMAASTAINMTQSLVSGIEQYSVLDRQKNQEEFSAFQAQKQGEANRDILLESGRKIESTAKSQLAAEGFDFNTGTGAVILNEIVQNSQASAMSAMLEGRVASIQHQYNADILKMNKKQTILNTGMTLLGQGMSAASSFKQAKGKGLI